MVVAVGVTVMVAVVCDNGVVLPLVVPVQAYVLPPLAVSVTGLPEVVVVVAGVTPATGEGLTVTGMSLKLGLHDAVITTRYVVVAVGETVNERAMETTCVALEAPTYHS